MLTIHTPAAVIFAIIDLTIHTQAATIFAVISQYLEHVCLTVRFTQATPVVVVPALHISFKSARLVKLLMLFPASVVCQ